MNKEIKEENKKAKKKFFAVMIAAAVGGAVIGFLSNMDFVQNLGDSLKGGIGDFVYIAAPMCVILCNAIVVIAGIIYFQKGKNLYMSCRNMDEDEAEEELDEIGRILSKGMIVINIGMVVSYGFFACFAVGMKDYVSGDGVFSLMMPLLVVAAFLVGMLGSVKLSQLYVDLMKMMNPRLSGCVYDSKFHEKWEDSCDELEKMMIYKSAYRAFLTTNKVCSFLWVVTMILGMFYDIGALPAVVVTIIWGAMALTYYKEAYRLEHGRKEK